MSETNEIRYTNEDQIDNTIRYTNDDVPDNEKGASRENSGYSEFGSTAATNGGESGTKKAFDYSNMAQIASTFVVVSIVAMAVVMDDSPFSAMFDPITGFISESFGISSGDSGYSGDCEISLVATDTDISYAAYFSVDPGQDTYLRVSNYFTDRTVHLSDEASWTGTVSGLQNGMKYDVTVTVGGKVVSSHSVSTLKEYDSVPVFTMVYERCYCLEDGTFHFMFSVVDRNSVWSDYKAELVFADGSVSECQFTSDVFAMQSIVVPSDKIGVDTSASLVVTCTEELSDGSTAAKTLYNQTVSI